MCASVNLNVEVNKPIGTCQGTSMQKVQLYHNAVAGKNLKIGRPKTVCHLYLCIFVVLQST
jgi:hypothetical protein